MTMEVIKSDYIVRNTESSMVRATQGKRSLRTTRNSCRGCQCRFMEWNASKLGYIVL